MAARLAAQLALARPAAPPRHARPQLLPAAWPLRQVAAASSLRLVRVRAGEEHASHIGDSDRRAVDKSEWLDAEAYGPVSAYCSAAPLAACTPDTPLGDIMSHFDEFTGAPRAASRAPAWGSERRAATQGLPVLDSDGCPVGVISEKDVGAYLQQYGDDTSRLSTPVSAVMSSPAVCIRSTARIAYAAGLMLQQCVAPAESQCLRITDCARPAAAACIAFLLWMRRGAACRC